MGSKIVSAAIFFLFWQALVMQCLGIDFDVKKYGAKADGKSDDSQAFMSAWQRACTCTDPSTVVVPGGTYMVGPVQFQGPCKAPVAVQVQGTLKAPVDLNKFKLQDGWVIFQDIDSLTVSGGGAFDGQGRIAWAENDCARTGNCNFLPSNLRFTKVTNSIIQHITSLNSKMFHMSILNCRNMTLQHVTINAPGASLNTDGIHVGRSTGVNVSDADIETGDDCISLGDGSQHINIEKVTCGPGHGISVGSLGKYRDEEPVIDVTVKNCTLINTMNGIRIKTWPDSRPGVATDLHFREIIMNNVGTPIFIDQEYCPYDHCQPKVPSSVKISNVSFQGIRGTSSTELAVELVCSRGEPCQNVDLSDINLTYNGKEGPAISVCANVKPILSGKVLPPACTKPAQSQFSCNPNKDSCSHA